MDKNPNIYYVYTHRHPSTDIVFYVGKGSKERAWDCGNRSINHKAILAAYTDLGYLPSDWVCIEYCGLSEGEAYEKEFELLASLPPQFLANEAGLRLSTAEKQRIATIYQSGESYASIAKISGYDHKTLVKALEELGIKPRASYRKGETRYDHDKIISLFKELNDTKKVANAIGCSYSLVCSVISKHDPDYRGKVRGWRKHNPNLIRSLRDLGMSYKDITRATGASSFTIKRAVKANNTQS